MEALATTTGGEESLPIGFGVGFGFGATLAHLIDRRIGQAEQDASDGAKHARGVGMTHAAEVFLHRDVQAVVKAAFDDPVAALELEHAQGLELIQGEAAHQVNDLLTPLALTANAGVQARDQTSARKSHLAGGDFNEFQQPDFRAASVLLLDAGLGLRRGWWGKKPVL